MWPAAPWPATKLNPPFLSNSSSILVVEENLEDSGKEFATIGPEQQKYQDEKQPEIKSCYEKAKSKQKRKKSNVQRRKKVTAIVDKLIE